MLSRRPHPSAAAPDRHRRPQRQPKAATGPIYRNRARTVASHGPHPLFQPQGCSASVDSGLALKGNQPQLYQDVTETFDQARQTGFACLDHDFHETVNKGHGRIETRRCWSVSDPDHLSYLNDRNEWINLASVVMVESERIEDGKTSTQTRYYISSLPNDARLLLANVRAHWGIENSVHWVLDVSFGEDDSRVRKGNAAENLSVLRRMALNMLKRETTSQGGVAAKRKRAGWDEDYLLLVLAQ